MLLQRVEFFSFFTAHISPHTCQNGYHQQINKQQVLARMWRKGNPFALLVGMQTGTTTVESSMEIPQKFKNGSVLLSSNSTSVNLSKETQNINSKEHKYPYVHCSLLIITKIWKQPKCPSIDEWIKQPWTSTKWKTIQREPRWQRR